MKLASTFLYDLVHKLSKSEKRYIKVQQGYGEKEYLALLDALLAHKSFDEIQFAKDNQGANFLKNLSVNKRYLYEIVLKSLSNFGEKTIENLVFEKISSIEVLINKTLYAAANVELKKALKITSQYELFELQIMLLGIEKKIRSIFQLKIENKENPAEIIFNKEKYCLSQLINTSEYWFLNQQISEFQMKYQKIETATQKKYFEVLVNSPQFKNEELATNIKSKIYYFQANATYQFMIGNQAAAYHYNQSFLDFLESNPLFLKIYAERYLATLNNLLIDSFGMGKFDMLEEGIFRLDKIPERIEFKRIKNIEASVFRQKYLLLLNWYLRQQEFEKALELIPEIEMGLLRFGKNIEKHHRITFYYLLAYVLFINKDFKQSLRWNEEIIFDSKEDVVKEIYYFARVKNLVLNYEIGNLKLLDSLLLSTPKYLRARRSLYKTEKTLFTLLKKLLNSADKKEREKHFSQFRKELIILFEVATEKRIFSYLDLRLWAK